MSFHNSVRMLKNVFLRNSSLGSWQSQMSLACGLKYDHSFCPRQSCHWLQSWSPSPGLLITNYLLLLLWTGSSFPFWKTQYLIILKYLPLKNFISPSFVLPPSSPRLFLTDFGKSNRHSKSSLPHLPSSPLFSYHQATELLL